MKNPGRVCELAGAEIIKCPARYGRTSRHYSSYRKCEGQRTLFLFFAATVISEDLAGIRRATLMTMDCGAYQAEADATSCYPETGRSVH